MLADRAEHHARETVFGASPETGVRAWDDAIAWSGLENAAYDFVTMVSAVFLVGSSQKIGAERVHAVALGLAALSRSRPSGPGSYTGILTMTIVVPMLILVTSGRISTDLLDSSGSQAIRLAGILLAIGAVAMLCVNPPDEADESPIMPLGAKRSITVYDRVVVGSDGDAAQALLDTVGANAANLVVGGNRGLGAKEGQLLGSVPGDVVENAVCDVLVVQTPALDENRLADDRLFARDPAGADPGTAPRPR